MSLANIKKPNHKIIIPLVLFFMTISIPSSWIPIENLSVIEQRVLGIFILAAALWILEPIPIYATSMLVISMELIIISNKSFIMFRNGETGENYNNLIDFSAIIGTLSSPIIILFLGGFFLAMGATKYRLDQNLARIMLSPFGNKPQFILLGIMVITAMFSMFMSNTATTAMMLSILVPVLAYFPPGDKGKTAFALSIPLAANIGGIGTPIGTPPNAIAMSYLNEIAPISFAKWMSFGVPIVLVMLVFAWFILLKLFPTQQKSVVLEINSKFIHNQKAYIVYVTFVLTVLLWLTDFIHGMNAYVVAMIPVAVFLTFGILNKEDIKRISWDVLWLVSGGIALGLALDQSGLAVHAVESIPFTSFSPLTIFIGAALIGAVMANFMSNTATANLLLPIIAAVGTSISSLEQFGGTGAIILTVALATSLGMALPISTPPNALAYATGNIETTEMSKAGIMTGIFGLIIIFTVVFILNQLNFF